MTDIVREAKFEESHELMADWLSKVTWQILQTKDRPSEQAQKMINAAHGALFHWGEIGAPDDVARCEWHMSTVYVEVKRPIPAYYHAQRSLTLCEAHELSAFATANALKALAVAAGQLKDHEAFKEHLEDAREWGKKIEDSEQKRVFLADLEELNPPAESC